MEQWYQYLAFLWNETQEVRGELIYTSKSRTIILWIRKNPPGS